MTLFLPTVLTKQRFFTRFSPKRWCLLLISAVVVIGLDQVSKTIADHLGWTLVPNQGIAFGINLGSLSWTLAIASLALFVAMLVFWSVWSRHPVSAGLFLGGAISNLIDRFLLGGVRDWLPVIGTSLYNNLADWAIFIGILGALYGLWSQHSSSSSAS